MNNATHSATPAGLPGPDRQAIKRLFRPGPGTAPPVLAGRAHEEKALGDLLAELRADKPDREAVVFGPRGNGKTVLLERFRTDCQAAGVATLALDPSEIDDLGALALALLEPPTPHAGADPSVPDNISASVRRGADAVKRALPSTGALHVSGVQAGVPGAKLTLEQMPPERLVASLRPLLAERCRQMPLVVTLDEAHTLDEEVGRRLLNLSQHLRTNDKVPFLLVLAGTPNLRDHLSAIQATFWSRAAKLGIGRLSEAATRQALVEPLAPHGVTFSADALVAVVDESQRYPYFIQVWGKALCNVLVEQGGQHIDADIVAAARPEFEAEHTDYYADRYNELEKQKLLPVAGAVTALFTQAPTWDRTALKNHLCAELSLKEDDALDAIRRLSHLGYVWEDYGKDRMEPGIPSLMSYVGERVDRALMPENQEPDPPAAPGPD